jgi:hypothetical protein
MNRQLTFQERREAFAARRGRLVDMHEDDALLPSLLPPPSLCCTAATTKLPPPRRLRQAAKTAHRQAVAIMLPPLPSLRCHRQAVAMLPPPQPPCRHQAAVTPTAATTIPLLHCHHAPTAAAATLQLPPLRC